MVEEWRKSHGQEEAEAFEKIEKAMRKMSYDYLVDTRVETKKELVQAWAQDRSMTPTESHLMLAYTNKDACFLNEYARAIMREQGVLTGKDFVFKTITQEDNSGQKLTKSDEMKCLDLAKFAEGRMKELARENGAQNSVGGNSGKTPDNSPNLETYRLTRELTQMHAHQNRHGVLPTGESLLKIQEQVHMETQKLSEKILTEQTVQIQRDRNMRQGMRM